MIEIFDLLAEVWDEAFSWFVYPIRIPLLTVASAVVIWIVLRKVVAPLNGAAGWTGAKLSRLLGSVLLAPEYGCTLLFIGQGRGIPLALRMYGEWVENIADWTTNAGKALGRVMQACAGVSFKVVAACVLLYLALYNVHALGSADEPAAPEAPVVVWWDSFKSWADADEHPLWEDGTPVSPSPGPNAQPSPQRSHRG